MNRNISILIAFVVIASAVVLAYGNTVGFIVIDNIPDPEDPEITGITTTTTTQTTTVYVDPTFTVTVKDPEGIEIDWSVTDTIVSGTLKFEAEVTNAGSNVKEISEVVLKVYTATESGAIDEYKGTFVFVASEPQEVYDLSWDTTTVTDGMYVLQVEYMLITADSGGGDDGGGYDVAFSMSLDTSESGSAGVKPVSVVPLDYTIPLIIGVFIVAAIAYLAIRTRR